MLSLLLHMHQPDYRDPATGAPCMPWVRLHATRGYRDVPRVVAETGARVTVNLVPSLLDQWEHYALGGSDPHLDLARRRAQDLEPHEVHWMLSHFFAGNEGVYTWFPAWGDLRARRDAGERFSVAMLRDVQVWAQLSWFGFTALQNFPALGELRRKGRDFSEDDKRVVLDLQLMMIRELPSLYRTLPEVSASPAFHPILPLLVNTAHAQRCMPGVPDPGFRWPDDASEHLHRARARVSAWAGRKIEGLWPSEGSVSPEVVELAAEAGFTWFATDQEVLERSVKDAGNHLGPWQVGRMRGLFRDRGLSDRIGFVYSSWRGEEAAADLIARLPQGPVLLALDGENPWEAYPDAGAGFLRALLTRARTRTCAEMAADKPRGRVRTIHTGSWIGGDFRIWIGHTEDRIAWEKLVRCREEWERRGRPEAAREHLLAAEGSDWFWWYGEEFDTPFAGEFDRLFRAHLAAAWRAMGGPVPDDLAEPIKRIARPDLVPPRARLPDDDGEDWFSWAPAGRLDLRAGAMAPMKGVPRALLFGERRGCLHLRLVPSGAGWKARVDGRAVPFQGDRAMLDGDVSSVVLEGPEGMRFPAEGTLHLPWRARLPERPC